MDVIIVLFVSMIACDYCNVDFCIMITFGNLIIKLYQRYLKRTNDETTKR